MRARSATKSIYHAGIQFAVRTVLFPYGVLMTTAEASRRLVPRAWPVWAALGTAAALVLTTIGVDVMVARRVARRTAEIVEDTQRSIELVDDLRQQAQTLSARAMTSRDVHAVRARIAVDAREYDPLAISPGERDEWNRLQNLLQRLEDSPADTHVKELAEINASIDRLVVINRRAAEAHARAIAKAHRSSIFADITVGAITLALFAAIALVLLRLQRRERGLIEEHIALLNERNRELDAFAARAAHDLRVPLNPIRGYADLLASGEEPVEEVREMALRIRQAVQRMNRTIDDMLELARAAKVDGGRASVGAVLQEALDEVRAELRDAEVRREVAAGEVACGPGVLALILRNLLGNAIKFRSRDRRLVVTISSRPDGDGVELIVADNGVGMDAESAEHAFEPGYRGRADREIPGHGLGLAIVERATRAVGGTCALSSIPDEGTRVIVRLPRAEWARQDAAPPAANRGNLSR
jgi:signal transduction histidine kinase